MAHEQEKQKKGKKGKRKVPQVRQVPEGETGHDRPYHAGPYRGAEQAKATRPGQGRPLLEAEQEPAHKGNIRKADEKQEVSLPNKAVALSRLYYFKRNCPAIPHFRNSPGQLRHPCRNIENFE